MMVTSYQRLIRVEKRYLRGGSDGDSAESIAGSSVEVSSAWSDGRGHLRNVAYSRVDLYKVWSKRACGSYGHERSSKGRVTTWYYLLCVSSNGF